MQFRFVESLSTVRHRGKVIGFALYRDAAGELVIAYRFGGSLEPGDTRGRVLTLPEGLRRLPHPQGEAGHVDHPSFRFLSSSRFLYLFRLTPAGYTFVHRYLMMERLGRDLGRIEPYGRFLPTIPKPAKPGERSIDEVPKVVSAAGGSKRRAGC